MTLTSSLHLRGLLAGLLALGLTNLSCDSDGDAADETITTEQTLGPEDQQALLYLLEEEKLARNVYTYLGSLWGGRIFDNITQSEIQHVGSVEGLLTTYGVDYESLPPGAYNNEELQGLYDALVARGEADLEAALVVGCTIEDLDIVDLQAMIDQTSVPALTGVYSSLQCGSRNHLRAFSASLEALGASYTPQYLSQEAYTAILESGRETCN
ncbi:DUF2202 domain-containing protein [Robiginitalea marina]|uniref:DUF2202 domain-containing protein n=1 Tax=Robiginitalea marina TaxID=2954105 RepID=A0ABT1AZN1_9FLAO|nr:DUF2202 domain-containing protein [Robiginitalea marina]MCO5725396.1 DUF2202 domain-containing protein [Robiginitalea marina]